MRTFLDIYEGWDPESTNYLQDLDETFLIIKENDSAAILRSLSEESRFLIDTFYSTDGTVMEAGNVTINANKRPIVKKNVSSFAEKMSEFFKRMIDFLANAGSKFMDSVANIFTSNQQFIKDNYALLTNMPVEVINTISINVIPYNRLGAVKRLLEPNAPENGDPFAFFDRVLSGNVSDVNKIEMHDNMDFVRSYFGNSFYKLDSSDLKHAVMLYYCGFKEPATEQYTGQNAQQEIIAECNFLRNYKATASVSKRFNDKVQQKIKDLNKKMDEYRKKAEAQQRQAEAAAQNAAKANAANQAAQSGGNNKSGTANNANQQGNTGSTQQGAPTQGKNQSNAQKTAVTSAFIAFYGPDMYSALEGTDIRNSEIGYALGLATEDVASIVTAGGPTPNPQANAQKPQPANNNTGGNNAAPAQNNTNDQAQKQADDYQAAVLKFGQVLLSTYATIAACRMTVCEQIASHYRKILEQVVAGINQYNQNRDQNIENINYNVGKEREHQQAQANYIRGKQEEAERNKADYKARHVNRGKLRGAWAKLFGNGQ